MALTFAANNLVQEGKLFTADLSFIDNSNFSKARTITSPEYLINCSVVFQAMVIRYEWVWLYFVKFIKKTPNDELTYNITYSHKLKESKDNHAQESFITDNNNTWRLISEFTTQWRNCTFCVSMSINLIATPCSNVSLYDDLELTDFELRGEDGSIHFHKAIAAAASPVLKTSFKEEWTKETKCVSDAPRHTSMETLQHLKDYMYLGTLPDTGLEQLILLASFYMMPALERRCVYEMLTGITAEKAYDLIEFAMKHQISQILFGIMQHVQDGNLNVDKIKKNQKWTLT